jgi:hypothetical protein
MVIEWLDFAKTSTLFLVTGCIKSQSWGIGAISNASSQGSFSLKLNLETAAWENSITVGRGSFRAGIPDYRVGPVMPSNSKNQCVFLHGFQLSTRRWMLGRKGVKIEQW